VNRNEADFVAFSLNSEVHHALTTEHVAQEEPTESFTADAVIDQGGENRPVADSFERIVRRRVEQPPRLRVAEGRGGARTVVSNAIMYFIESVINAKTTRKQPRDLSFIIPPSMSDSAILRQQECWGWGYRCYNYGDP
jgi:hypothetical protein